MWRWLLGTWIPPLLFRWRRPNWTYWPERGKLAEAPLLWDGQAARRIVEVQLRLAPGQKAP
ncbi:MAG TPA: hypothetical protein VJN92_18355 [Candidatus Acidoferrum sp.]|nr:hypothetical protein [Candidatus Acidoferrum sp.]